ncbi:MAG: hypothetical protein ACTSU5_16510 [Promethearchaeota archaeon]
MVISVHLKGEFELLIRAKPLRGRLKFRDFQTGSRVFSIKRCSLYGDESSPLSKFKPTWLWLETAVRFKRGVGGGVRQKRREVFVGRVLSEYPSEVVVRLGRSVAKRFDASFLVFHERRKGGGRLVVALSRVGDGPSLERIHGKLLSLGREVEGRLGKLLEMIDE